MSTQRYRLPPSGTCPGCGAIVMLPGEPLFPDTPPAICAECNTEVPDYRRENYSPEVHRPHQPIHLPPAPRHFVAPPPPPKPVANPTPVEHRVYSRGGLLRSIGGLLAERGAEAVESAKGKIPPG